MSKGFIRKFDDVDPKIYEDSDKLKNVKKYSVIPVQEGWDYVLRKFVIGKGGFTPKHTHPWVHINYIVKGEGTLFLNGKENPVKAGDYAYVPPNEEHQFKNIGEEDFEFICIVPPEGDM